MIETENRANETTRRLQSRFYQVGDLRLHVRELTRGKPPLVMVHGFVISSRYMIPSGLQLAEDFDIYAVDMPGFGRSQHPPEPMDIPDLAECLARWMDVAGIERAHFLGNSFGTQVSSALAVRHPERVSRLVLSAPTPAPEARTHFQQAYRLLKDLPRERLSLLWLQALSYWHAGFRQTIATSAFAVSDQVEERLPHVRAPTLVVRGARDPVVDQAWAERVAELLPNGKLVVVPGAPHATNYSFPDEFVRVVRPFLKG